MAARKGARPVPASSWSDWGPLFEHGWYGFDARADGSRLLADVDREMRAAGADGVTDYRARIRSLIGSPVEGLTAGRFTYDEASGTLDVANAYFSESLDDFTFFFAVVRGIAAFQDDEGFAVVRNYFHADPGYNLAVMRQHAARCCPIVIVMTASSTTAKAVLQSMYEPGVAMTVWSGSSWR